MSNENETKNALTEADINAAIKAALMQEFKQNVGFKHVTLDDALNYITFTVVQRVKQRLRSKEERDNYNMLKQKHPELFKKLQNK